MIVTTSLVNVLMLPIMFRQFYDFIVSRQAQNVHNWDVESHDGQPSTSRKRRRLTFAAIGRSSAAR